VCAEHRKTRPAVATYRFGAGYGLVRYQKRSVAQTVADGFDVFITSDKNLRYQQNLAEVDVAILLLPSNQVSVIKNLLPQIDEALSLISPQSFVEI